MAFVVQNKYVIRTRFLWRENREIPLVSQGKNSHNICGVRLDCGPEGNILKNVLIIRSGGHESWAGDFLFLAKVYRGSILKNIKGFVY